MAQYFNIHPDNPQGRLIKQAVEIINKGGVIAYPTDSSYAFGCHIGDKEAMERIVRIRRIKDDHNFTLVCSDLSELSVYAKVDNNVYRLLKRFTPGPYTFILAATRETPRRLQNPKRRSIGLRVPDYPIVSAMLTQLGEPIMSSTLILPDQGQPLNDAQTIRDELEHDVDLVIDGGACDMEPTSVVSFMETLPRVLRAGKGDVSYFE
ncbi:MAG: threonylcarbamoyl-AMP synthase [Gammaproteobacteria bacterium]|nr:threonylcarbamoyl-AMP synthase [Gammaproteobacteria bacterium]NKB65409.1 threonylcarbamoyl-AMP synthase [Gammaproteobacteria bacterium]